MLSWLFEEWALKTDRSSLLSRVIGHTKTNQTDARLFEKCCLQEAVFSHIALARNKKHIQHKK
jgi:hypothetical protein